MSPTEPRKAEPSTGQSPDAGKPQQQWRIPRRPLLLILALLAVFAWVAWLMQSRPPRPYPEVPPHKVIPADIQHPQDPRTHPGSDAGQRP